MNLICSFAGGKCDLADRDVVATALRETWEELGISVAAESVWGVLKPLCHRVSPALLLYFTCYALSLFHTNTHTYT